MTIRVYLSELETEGGQMDRLTDRQLEFYRTFQFFMMCLNKKNIYIY